MSETIDFAALAEPFPADVVGWKAQTVKDGRALAVPYIDARDVQDRLDAVVGPANWQDSYTVLPDGNVVCRLSLLTDTGWITKEDVGGESDQQDEGDKRKAAFSDALKRAAIKWGVGRYLYRLPRTWVDYDQQKKQIKQPPRLPDRALPGRKTEQARPAVKSVKLPPKTAAELQERITQADEDGAKVGKFKAGALVAYVIAAGKVHQYPDDLASWPVKGIPVATEAATTFIRQHKNKPAA